MKLSDQAIGAIMMALQNSLMHQTDIVPTFQDFHFQLNDKEELMVLNPPSIEVPEGLVTALGENKTTVGSD